MTNQILVTLSDGTQVGLILPVELPAYAEIEVHVRSRSSDGWSLPLQASTPHTPGRYHVGSW